MKYRSKIDLNRFLVIALIIFVLVMQTYRVFTYFNIFSSLLLILWIYLLYRTVMVLFTTYYKLESNFLYVRSGKTELYFKYVDIARVEMTSFNESGLALSKDCIIVVLKTGNGFAISPKNKEEFIENLNQRITLTNSL